MRRNERSLTPEGHVRTAIGFWSRGRLHDGAEPLPGGRLSGVPTGGLDVRVHVAGFGTTTVTLDPLAPGETRPLLVVVERGSELRFDASRGPSRGRAGGTARGTARR